MSAFRDEPIFKSIRAASTEIAKDMARDLMTYSREAEIYRLRKKVNQLLGIVREELPHKTYRRIVDRCNAELDNAQRWNVDEQAGEAGG